MIQRTSARLWAFILFVQLSLSLTLIQPLPAATNNLQGQVVDGAGQPVANLELVVQQQFDEQGHAQWQVVARSVTDDQGRYALADLNLGTYQVGLSAAAQRLRLPDLVVLDEANIQPARTAASAGLLGTVTDVNGQAIPDVAVSLYTVMSRGESNLYYLIRRTLTDDQGGYQFPNLAAGRYELAFADIAYPERYLPEDYPDPVAEPEQSPLIILTDSQRQVDVQMALAGLLTGQVTDKLGKTLPNIWVSLFRQAGSTWQQVNTATTLYDGSYTFTALAAGTYRLRFQDGGASQIYAPEFYNDAATLVDATDIVLLVAGARMEALPTQLTATSQIMGRVTDQAGHGIGWISVKLYHDPVGAGTWLPTDYGSLTDHTGVYQISGLPAGVYRAEFVDLTVQPPPRYQPQFYNNAARLATAANLTVGVGETLSGIDAQLFAPSHIQGQVTTAIGRPAATATVVLYGTTDTGSWQELNRTATDTDGFYDLAGVTTGVYRVGFGYAWGDPPVEFYANAPTIESATDIVVGPQTTVRNIDGRLATPGAIAGVITDENGQVLADIGVRAWRQNRQTTAWQPVAYDQSAGNGAYQLNNLAAGYYRLEFSEPSPMLPLSKTAYDNAARAVGDFSKPNHLLHHYEPEYYNDAATLEQATTIVVLSGETRSGIDARLALRGSISGQVVDPAGNPVAQITVIALRRLFDGVGKPFWAEVIATTTNAAGEYTLAHLERANYRLLFRDSAQPARYVTEYYDNVSAIEDASEIQIDGRQATTSVNVQLATSIAPIPNPWSVWMPAIRR